MILCVGNVGWAQLGGPWVLVSHLWLAIGELGGSVSEGGLAAGWGHEGTGATCVLSSSTFTWASSQAVTEF